MSSDMKKQLVSRSIKPPKWPEGFFYGPRYQRQQKCLEMIFSFLYLCLIYVEPKGTCYPLQCQSTWQMARKTNADSQSPAFRIGKRARDKSLREPYQCVKSGEGKSEEHRGCSLDK